MISAKAQAEFNAHTYNHVWHPEPVTLRRIKQIIKLIGTHKRVLDIGCFDGTIAALIKSQGNEVIGVDISPTAINLSRQKGIQSYCLNLETNTLPPRLGKFDIILASEIIEHIFDPDKLLQKAHRLLVTGGKLIITTPNLASLGSRLSLLVGITPWMIENDCLPGRSGHIRYFTPATLNTLLVRNGFKMQISTTDGVGFGLNFNFPYLHKIIPSWGRILIITAQRI